MVSTAQNLVASNSSAKIIRRLTSAYALYFDVRAVSLRVCYSLQYFVNFILLSEFLHEEIWGENASERGLSTDFLDGHGPFWIMHNIRSFGWRA